MVTKSDFLKSDKPLSDKIGSMTWGWDNLRSVEDSLYIAGKMSLQYMRYPYNISRNQVDYDTYSSVWQQGLDSIISKGITPIITFHASNNDDRPEEAETDDQLAYYHDIITKVISNNSSKGIVWESWNEANGSFWSKSPTASKSLQQIVDIHNFIRDTVHTMDNDAVYIGPTLDGKYLNYTKGGIYQEKQGGLSVFLQAYKDGGSFENIDGVSIHPYPDIRYNGGNPEQYIKELSNWKDYIGELPLIPTEFGYSIAIPDPPYSWQTTFSLHEARVKTIREILIMDMLGCPVILPYSLGGNNYTLGNTTLLSGVGEALSSFISRIKGYTFKEKLTVTDHDKNSEIDDLYVLKYSKEGSSDIAIYWSVFPNVAGTVATSPNVTHKLYFQDMPQIIAI